MYMKGYFKSLAATSIAMAAVSVCGAQPALHIDTTTVLSNGSLQTMIGQLSPNLKSGTLLPLRYAYDGVTPGLQIRAQRPILCLATEPAGDNTFKQLVLDPNGYFPPVQLAEQAAVRATGEILNYGPNAYLRGSDVLRFGPAGFTTGVAPNVEFYLGEIGAYCAITPSQDSPPPTTTECTTADFDDNIMAGRFEAEALGTATLSVTSRSLPPSNTMIEYTYTIHALGGPVYDVALREQFPYFRYESTEPPLFARSYALEHNWHCTASAGANCDSRGRQLDGAGYVHLEAGSIQTNGCLKITTQRVRRTDGLEAQPFSGRLYTAVFFKRAPGAQTQAQRSFVVQRNPLP